MKTLVVLGLLGISAAVPLTAFAYGDRAAIAACEDFQRAFQRYKDGVVGVGDIQWQMRSVYSAAERSSDVKLRETAAALVRTSDLTVMSKHRAEDFGDAARMFADHCLRMVLAPPEPQLPPKPSRPIPQGEAEQQVKGVLERSDATDAKCEKKQYGTGWATICE